MSNKLLIEGLSMFDDESKFSEYLIEKIHELEDQIEELYWKFFEEELEKPSWDPGKKCLEPLIEIEEQEDNLIIRMDLPLVKKEDINIKCTESSLEVTAKLKKNICFEKWGTVQRETEFCMFHKIVHLPVRVIPEKATAKFTSGVLEIILPKRKPEYKIKVK